MAQRTDRKAKAKFRRPLLARIGGPESPPRAGFFGRRPNERQKKKRTRKLTPDEQIRRELEAERR
jgi:hypothetical protein